MKNIKLLSLIIISVMVISGILITKNTKAAVAPGEDGGHKKFVACNIVSEGGVVQYGNTCESGTKNCISNPCG